jgi:hypothetical protein
MRRTPLALTAAVLPTGCSAGDLTYELVLPAARVVEVSGSGSVEGR